MKDFDPIAGMEIGTAIRRSVAMADNSQDSIRLKFNGTETIINPGDNPDTVHEAWVRARHAEHAAYLASPECARAEAERKLAVAFHQELYNAAAELVCKFDSAGAPTLPEIAALRDVCRATDFHGVQNHRGAEMVARLRSIGFKSITELTPETCETANTGAPGFGLTARWFCIVGNCIQANMAAHPVAIHFLDQLEAEIKATP